MTIDSLAVKFCRHMGLDPQTVSKLELTFLPNDQITAKVHTWMKANGLPEFELLEECRLVRVDEVKVLEDRIDALEEQLEESERNDARWRAIRPLLDVNRSAAGSWTCWLSMQCVPLRSLTTDPDELADMLVKLADERKQKS